MRNFNTSNQSTRNTSENRGKATFEEMMVAALPKLTKDTNQRSLDLNKSHSS